MAHDRANLRVDLWADDDWRRLTVPAQHLYMLLLSHPTRTYCGVVDWRPGRLASLSVGATRGGLLSASQELQGAAFIYVDNMTEEVFIRSFVRHDGVLRHAKLPISMANDYAAIASTQIRKFFIWELRKQSAEQPELNLWTLDRIRTLLKGDAEDLKTQVHGRAHAHGDAKGYTQPALQMDTRGDTNPNPEGMAKPLLKGLPSDSMPTTTATTTSSKEDTSSSEIADALSRPDVEELLDLLKARVVGNDFKAPTRTKRNWDAARLLLDRDGHTIEQVTWVIDWATSNEFWRPNIRSMSKLREKFDQLKAQAMRGQPQTAGRTGEIDPDRILGADYWTPGTPPEGLSLEEQMAWAKGERSRHEDERKEEAMRRAQSV